MRRRRATAAAGWLALGACALGALGACTFGERDVPAGVDKPVVHAVLNAATLEQSVLVERTLTGRVNVSSDTFAMASDPKLGMWKRDVVRTDRIGPVGTYFQCPASI